MIGCQKLQQSFPVAQILEDLERRIVGIGGVFARGKEVEQVDAVCAVPPPVPSGPAVFLGRETIFFPAGALDAFNAPVHRDILDCFGPGFEG